MGMSFEERSESLVELAKDFCLAQAELMNPEAKGRVSYKNVQFTYARLDDCYDQCRAALPKHGFSYPQFPTINGKEISVKTVLLHKSGEYISNVVTLTANSSTPQEIGSAITYARRYGLCSLVGMVSDKDTDASNHAGKNTDTRKTDNVVNNKMLAKLFATANERKIQTGSLKRFIADKFNVTSTKDLSLAQYNQTISWLESQVVNELVPSFEPDSSPSKVVGAK